MACPCPAAIAPNPTCPALPIAPLQCLHKAIEICKPGTPYREIGDVISKHAKQHK
jgi:methionine aminopeptidase